ncbi:MAG: PP2C family protein-serine/threonine phosphatase [Lachnospiraceae bacterium]|nr:PP2C family protein-serine/threonine phosphatase [Lachnospiraceae bacterium]
MQPKVKDRKKRKPLEKALYKTMITGLVIIFIMVGTVMFVLYPFATLRAIKRDTNGDMAYLLSTLDEDYIAELYGHTKEIYHSIPEENRKDRNNEEYLEHFRELTRDERYIKAREALKKCREVQKLGNMGMLFSDDVNRRMVFVLDGDTDEKCFIPGQWVDDVQGDIETPQQIQRVLNSGWYMVVGYTPASGFAMSNYMRVTDKNGEVIGLVFVNIILNDLISRIGTFTLVYMFIMLIVITLMIIYISKFLKERVVTPLGLLSDAALRYTARDKTVASEQKGYFESVDIRTDDEIGDLLRSLTDMETDISDTMQRIREMTAAKERLDTELSIANHIQADILPGRYSEFPERKDFSLFALMTPAREVGGDFYDYFLIDEDHIALVIADVSDKGVPAALFMMTARTMIRTRGLNKVTPAAILSFANKELCRGNEEGLFVTVWMTIIELSTGRGLAANAGHTHPAICHSGGRYELKEYDHCLPLGIMEDASFEQHAIQLQPGDRLFVYTDGVNEAADPTGQQFGTDRMIDALNLDPDASPEDTLNNVLSSVRAFAEGAEQADDITMLGFRYTGQEITVSP